MGIIKKDFLKYVDSKRSNIATNSIKYTVMEEKKKEDGSIYGFGENTVINLTVYFVGEIWVCLYTKIQYSTTDGGVEYYYKLKCFSPLRSNKNIKYLYAKDESDIKKMCLKEVDDFVKRISSQPNSDAEFCKTMEDAVINMVEQRVFSINGDDFETKMYKP